MRYSAVPRVAIYEQPTWQRYDVLEIWLIGTEIDIDLSRFLQMDASSSRLCSAGHVREMATP